MAASATTRRSPGLLRWVLLVWAVACPGAALAEPSPAARAEFQELLRQRNALQRSLEQADRRAAQQLRRGDRADVEHAKQIALQDRLDTVNTRLESASIRHGLTIPPPAADDAAAPGAVLRERTRASLARGRHRALSLLRADALELLASLDLGRYMAGATGDGPH